MNTKIKNMPKKPEVVAEDTMETGKNNDKDPKSYSPFAWRLRLCARMAGSGDRLSEISNIPRRTLENYVTDFSEPKLSRIIQIAEACGVTLDWLLTGQEPQPELIANTKNRTAIMSTIPVMQLMPIKDESGWYKEVSTDAHAIFPKDKMNDQHWNIKQMKALMAAGREMLPAGIGHGFLCYYNNAVMPQEHQSIVIRRPDGMIKLRQLAKKKHHAMITSYWLPGTKEGVYVMEEETIALGEGYEVGVVLMSKSGL